MRDEVNTRFSFAKRQGEYWFQKMKGIEKSGNVVSSLATRKFIQANRIYTHYMNEFTQILKDPA